MTITLFDYIFNNKHLVFLYRYNSMTDSDEIQITITHLLTL